MALSDYKITSFSKPVSALDDTPQMSAAQLKEWFDSNSANEIKTSINGIVDEVGKALETKIDREEGKALSSNDFTDEEKQKLEGLSNYDDAQIKRELDEKIEDAPIDGQDYIRRDGQWVRSNDVTNGVVVFRSVVANEADMADRAKADEYGNNIEQTYATKKEVIEEAPIDGQDYVRRDGEWISSNDPVNGVVVFRAITADEADMAYADGSGNNIEQTYATKDEVGNIETALDNIIAIQNSLIGGDSV